MALAHAGAPPDPPTPPPLLTPAAISVADVKAALAKAGGAPSAELFVALQFADKTGLAGRFDPAWTLAAQQ